MLNLVSDSSCDLISGELNSPYARLTVAPMCLHVGGQDYLDTPELDIPALLSKLAHHIWLQNGRLTLRWQHGFHLHEICVLCPVPALTAMQSPWAAAVHRTNLTLTFPGGVKCRVRSVKCSELPFLLF